MGPRVTAVLAVVLLGLPAALLVAITPVQYQPLLLVAAIAPAVVIAGVRLPVGLLLAVGLVTPPLLQLLVQGGPEGIPTEAVLPLFGVELILLVRGLPALRGARRPALLEVAFLGAILFAAVVGLAGEHDRRAWLSELAETANLVVVLWLLRLNRVRFADLRSFVIAGHLFAAPFFAWYVFTSFGEYRLDFFFGLSTTLVPITIAVLLHTRAGLVLRGLLLASCFAILLSTAAAGSRGTTIIALIGTGLVVLFSLRRLSGVALVLLMAGLAALLLFQPFVIGLAGQFAPEAVERFRTTMGSPTLSVRVLEAQDAFAAFRERPMGLGLGAVLVTRHEIVFGSTGITIEYGPATFIHNSYAWYLAKTGVVGFMVLMLMLGSAAFAAVRRLSPTGGGASLSLALLLAFLAGAWGGPALHNVFCTPPLALALYFARAAEDPLASAAMYVRRSGRLHRGASLSSG